MKLRSLVECDVPDHLLDHEILECAPLNCAYDADRMWHMLRWYNGEPLRENSWRSTGGVLIAPHGMDMSHITDRVVRSSNPRVTFAQAMRCMYQHPVRAKLQIQPTSKVHDTAVIGKDGFGFDEYGHIPHIGGVTIGDRVTIGAHTCVDRATLGDTIIGDDTHIDNLVHIAHNVRIGKRCHIVAGAVIGGSAVLDDEVFVGINASIKNGVHIGAGAIVGMGAVVINDVPAGATVVGNPARIIKQS